MKFQTSITSRRVSMALAGVSLLAFSTAADAQSAGNTATLEEIIVTAQRRAENLQAVPIAVTSVTGDQLEATNANSLSDISRLAPSVQVGGLTSSQVVVRGVGQQQPGLFSDEGVAIFVDGVYRPRFQFNSVNFSDVSRLEVLRGPQGTLYGKNALGGALNIITEVPGNEMEANVDGQYGSREHVKLGGGVNLPLIADKASLRIAADYNNQKGYVHNQITGQDANNTNYYDVRGVLRLTPTENLEILARADYFKEDDLGPGYIFISAARPGAAFVAADRVVNSYYLGRGYEDTYGTNIYNKVEDRGVSLTVNWDVGPGTLTSITAHRRYTGQTSQDADGTPSQARWSPSDTYQKQFTQEVRYTAATASEAVRVTAGGFYYREDGSQASRTRDNADVNTSGFIDTDRMQIAESYAAFGELTVRPVPKLSLTAGGRYDEDTKDVSAQAYNAAVTPHVLTRAVTSSQKWTSFTPRGTVQYQFNPDIMAYGTVSKGFKAGGYNAAVSLFRAFEPETIWNYELGLKSELFDHKVRANFTVYQMDYSNIQLNQIVVVAPGVTAPAVSNAGDARVRGAEVELTVRPTADFRLNGAFGVNDFAYTRLNPGTGIASTAVLPNSPKYSANAGAEYTFNDIANGSVTLRADYSYRSRTFFDAANSPLTAQKAYGLLSSRITYRPEGASWSAYLYGSNLTDVYFKTSGFQAAGINSYSVGAPREIGIGFRYNLN